MSLRFDQIDHHLLMKCGALLTNGAERRSGIRRAVLVLIALPHRPTGQRAILCILGFKVLSETCYILNGKVALRGMWFWQRRKGWGLIMVDKNRVEGAVENVAGKVEETVGDIAGDASTQAEGKGHQVAGTVKRTYGETLDTARGWLQNISDMTIEQPLTMLLAVGTIAFVCGRFSLRNVRPRR
jgi:uncharacterized protein YjbJ (UPF0337 family)